MKNKNFLACVAYAPLPEDLDVMRDDTLIAFQSTPMEDEVDVPHGDDIEEPEGGSLQVDREAVDVDEHQVVGFLNAGEQMTVSRSAALDVSFRAATKSGSDLEGFFARPILLQALNWDLGVGLQTNFDPWGLFFANEGVKDKIRNYRFFRGTLHLSVYINGTPFHYGRAMMAYYPFYDEGYGISTNSHQRLMNLSMKPKVFIDPTSSETVELVLPFVCPLDYLVLPYGADTKYSDLGRIFIESINDLKIASTSVNNLRITIYGWMTDVSLTVPTVQDTAVLQAGKRKPKASMKPPAAKERQKDGIVTQVSSAVATAAGAIRNAPVLGGVASAVEVVASAVNAVASYFGWSRPIVATDPIYARLTTGSTTAHVMGKETVEKLTFDPHASVSIDPAVAGLGGEDEMTIKTLVERETLISHFNWNVDQVAGTELFWSNVTPSFASQEVAGFHQFTSLAFASLPFKYWSGSIDFRFQVVASQYHRGRLRVVWEPYTYTPTEAKMSLSFSKVIDISETRDVTMRVGWATNRPYLKVEDPAIQQCSLPGIGGIINTDVETCNGLLRVHVLNDLASPTSEGIELNVYVRAGPDFELFDPQTDTKARTTGIGSWTPYPPPPALLEVNEETEGAVLQSGTIPAFMAEVPQNNPNGSEMVVNLVEPFTPCVADVRPLIFSGEKVLSFRALTKRYAGSHFAFSHSLTPGTDPKLLRTDIPNYPGFAGSSYGTGRSEYLKTTLLSYLTTAYVGVRGALRHKTYCVMEGNPGFATINRVEDELVTYDSTVIATNTGAFFTNPFLGWWNGLAVANTANLTLETELPYKSNLRFYYAAEIGILSSPTASQPNAHHLEYCVYTPSDATYAYVVDAVATGDDFNLLWYTGPPRMRKHV